VTHQPWGKSRAQVVRLACPCGRNLADVRPLFGQPFVGVGPALRDGYQLVITVVARRGVRYSEHGRPGGGTTYRWDCDAARRGKPETTGSTPFGTNTPSPAAPSG
jgi:hypothetical protein